MKRTIVFLLLVSCMAAFVSAQEVNPRQQRRSNENRQGQTWLRQAPQGQGRGRFFHAPGNQSRGRQNYHHHGQSRNQQQGRGHQQGRGQATDRQRPAQPRNARPAIEAESVRVSGNLSLVQGRIAISSGGTTYIIGGLQSYVGFITGLNEGAAVTIEGKAFASPNSENTKILFAQKLTIGNKVYDVGRDFTRPRPNAGDAQRPQQGRQ